MTEDINAALRRAWRGEPAPEVPVQENDLPPKRISGDAGAGQGPDSVPVTGSTVDLNAAVRAVIRGRLG